MTAPPVDVLRWGPERVRAGPWRGDPHVAYVSPVPEGPPPSGTFLRRCLDTLAEQGFAEVVTGALSPYEQRGFLTAGFQVREELHLLGMDLDAGLPAVPDGKALRRPGRRRRRDVLVVDRAAFSPFWRFDAAGLADALAATPASRYRVAIDGSGRTVGYAICGRAGWRGFVQRLAVHPDDHGHGTGRRLLLDGLHWMRRHGVRRAQVNTQMGNDAALALYRRVGFRDEPTGLCVLAAVLT